MAKLQRWSHQCLPARGELPEEIAWPPQEWRLPGREPILVNDGVVYYHMPDWRRDTDLLEDDRTVVWAPKLAATHPGASEWYYVCNVESLWGNVESLYNKSLKAGERECFFLQDLFRPPPATDEYGPLPGDWFDRFVQAPDWETHWRLREDFWRQAGRLGERIEAALAPWTPGGFIAALRRSQRWHGWQISSLLDAARCCDSNAFNDLLVSNAALATCLATALRDDPTGELAADLEGLLSGSQSALAARLGWPRQPWIARMLRRWPAPLATQKTLDYARRWAVDGVGARELQRLPRLIEERPIRLGTTNLLLEEGLSISLLVRLLQRAKSARHRSAEPSEHDEKWNKRLDALLVLVFNIKDLAELRGVDPGLDRCHSLNRLKSRRKQLETELRTEDVLLQPEEDDIPSTLPAMSGVRRLRSAADLIDESRSMANCVRTYISRLKRSRDIQLWHWQEPEPMTVELRFDKDSALWVLAQAKTKGDRPIGDQGRAALSSWLSEQEKAEDVETVHEQLTFFFV